MSMNIKLALVVLVVLAAGSAAAVGRGYYCRGPGGCVGFSTGLPAVIQENVRVPTSARSSKWGQMVWGQDSWQG